MADREKIERIRQEVMRLRELLSIMSQHAQDGEQAYVRLFAPLSEEEMSTLKEKDRQWKAAEALVDDLTPLRNAVLDLRFQARDLERNFEQLYDIIEATLNGDF